MRKKKRRKDRSREGGKEVAAQKGWRGGMGEGREGRRLKKVRQHRRIMFRDGLG